MSSRPYELQGNALDCPVAHCTKEKGHLSAHNDEREIAEQQREQRHARDMRVAEAVRTYIADQMPSEALDDLVRSLDLKIVVEGVK